MERCHSLDLTIWLEEFSPLGTSSVKTVAILLLVGGQAGMEDREAPTCKERTRRWPELLLETESFF